MCLHFCVSSSHHEGEPLQSQFVLRTRSEEIIFFLLSTFSVSMCKTDVQHVSYGAGYGPETNVHPQGDMGEGLSVNVASFISSVGFYFDGLAACL